MRKILLVLFLFFPLVMSAEEGLYPWRATFGGGGASLCDEKGCFGPTGYTFGGSFGRNMSERWGFELEGYYAKASETGLPRVDLFTGTLYTPEFQHSRFWGGGAFLASLSDFGERNDFFIALGFALAYENFSTKAPEGIFTPPSVDIGIVGGVSGGAGINWWISENWALRPEVRYYLCANDLSGLRYTIGLSTEF